LKRDEAAPAERPGGFDEHERDTAPRAYSQEMVDSVRSGTVPNGPPPPVKRASDIQATAKIDRFELEAVLRMESGTRPAVTSDEIERFRENGVAPALDRDSSLGSASLVHRDSSLGSASLGHRDSSLGSASLGHRDSSLGSASLVDPHARPTVEAIPRSVIEAAEARGPTERIVTQPLVALSMPTPTPVSRIQPAPVTRLPRWVLPLVAVSVGIVVALAFSAGFVIGRFTSFTIPH